MATMYAGPNNVYVPAFDEQAKLIVNYSRDPKKYPVNNLMTVTPVKRRIGKYLRIKPEAQGRLGNNGRRWAEGAPRPIQLETGQLHEWLEFFCERYIADFPIGYNTEEQAVWDIISTQSAALANQQMTDRTSEFYTILQSSTNYDSNNSSTATAAGGGFWGAATSTSRYIQKSLRVGVSNIMKSTMNGVQADDLVLVVGPTVAGAMAESAEIADYLAQAPPAPEYLQGELFKNQLANYGLPPKLYGINVVVDPMVYETNHLGAASVKAFAAGENSAYLIARPGSINGNAGGSSFSFIHCFSYTPEEMLVETTDDFINKRKILSVVDTRQIKAVANEAGQLFTAVLS